MRCAGYDLSIGCCFAYGSHCTLNYALAQLPKYLANSFTNGLFRHES